MASLFTSETPSGVNNSDGTPGITFGVSLMFAVAGTVTAVRFFSTTTVSGAYTGAVWQVTADDNPGPGAGTLLGSDVLVGSPAAGAWVNIPLDPVVAVTPGVLYRAGVHSAAGRYVNSGGVFGSAVVNGDLTAPANGSDPVLLGSLAQGVFAINAALTFPATTGNGTNYFADVVFTPDGEAEVAPGSTTVSVAVGAPTVGLGLHPAPGSVAVPVALGSPTVSLGRSPAPGSTAVSVGLGAPTIGATQIRPVVPGSVTVGLAFGDPATVSDPTLLVAPRRGGWESYGAALRFNADEARRETERAPLDCPRDGEALEFVVDGRRHCPACGWEWPARRIIDRG